MYHIDGRESHIRNDGTIIRVALVLCEPSLQPSRDHSLASERVRAIKASVLNVLPIPISSARIPPPSCEGGVLPLYSSPVTLWRCLNWHQQSYLFTENARPNGAYMSCCSSQREKVSGTGPVSRWTINCRAFSWCLILGEHHRYSTLYIARVSGFYLLEKRCFEIPRSPQPVEVSKAGH
jgi:hypothetical protein